MDQHLNDMGKDLEYRTLLNRAEWLGFSSPQQAYSWRQQEYNQRLNMNRADQMGYATPDQYLGYLQKERSALNDLNSAIFDRADAYDEATVKALDYTDAVKDTHKSLGEFSDTGVQEAQQVTDAINNIPDVQVTTMKLDDSAAMAQLAAYRAELEGIPKVVSTDEVINAATHMGGQDLGQAALLGAPVSLNVDDSLARTKIQQFIDDLDRVSAMRVDVPADFNDAAAMTKMASFQAFLKSFRNVNITVGETVVPLAGGAAGGAGGPPKIPTAAAAAADEPNPNDNQAWEKLSASIADAVANLRKLQEATNSASDAAKAEYSINLLLAMSQQQVDRANNAGLNNLIRMITLTNSASEASKAAYAANLQYAQVADELGHSLSDADRAMLMYAGTAQLAGNEAADAVAASVASSKGSFLGLKSEVTLFAGVFGTTMLGMIAGWHLWADAIIETLAVTIPALGAMVIGLTAFGAAGYSTFKQIYERLTAVNTAATATGQTIPPLTNAMNGLQDSLRPQIWQIYGDAIDLVNHNTGTFGQIALATGSELDKLSARLTVFLENGSGGLNKFMAQGAADLHNFGNLFDGLGSVLMSFIHATALTQVAEHLLGGLAFIVDGLATALKAIPTPVIAAGIGIHSFLVYGGLFTTWAQRAVLSIDSLVGKIPALNGFATSVATSFGASSSQLEKLVANSNGLKAVADNMSMTALQAAQFKRGIESTGTSVVDMASQTQHGAELMDKYATSLDDAGKEAVGLSILAGGTEEAISKVAAESGDAAKASGFWSGAVALLTKIPLAGWIAIGVGAVVGIAIAFRQAADATQQWIINLNKSVQASNDLNGLNVLSNALFQTTSKLANAQTQLINAQNQQQQASRNQAAAINTSVKVTDNFAGSVRAAQKSQDALNNMMSGEGSGGAFSQYSQNIDQAGRKVDALTGEQKLLGTQMVNLTRNVGSIQSAIGVDLPTAYGLAQLAGVKFTDLLQNHQSKAFQDAMQQIHGLVSGYQAMGQGLTELQQDVNVQLVMNSEQVNSMAKLNKAWDSLQQAVAAPIGSFLNFQTAMSQFQADAQQAGASMTGLGKDASNLGKATQATVPTVSNAANQLQTQFQNVYTDVENMFDAMRNSEAITGKGGFVSFVKSAVAELIPLAGGNKAAAAEISQLAQEAGGPATTSLKELAKWTGNIKNPMQNLQNASNNAAIATSNLSQDASRLTTTLQQDLSNQMKIAIENTLGVQQAMENYTNSLKENGSTSPKTAAAQAHLSQILNVVTGSQQQTNQIINAGTQALTGNWTQVNKQPSAYNAMQEAMAKAHNPASVLNTDLNNITAAAVTYGTKSPQYHDALKQAHDDLTNAGVSAQTATGLLNQWTAATITNGLKSLAQHMNRQTLFNDINAIINITPNAKTDVDNMSNAIANHGTKSSQYHSARQQLINDLESAGVRASTATTLVNDLTTSLGKVPKNVQTNITAHASGTGTVTSSEQLANKMSAGHIAFKPQFADGGPFNGTQGGAVNGTGGGPRQDNQLILASSGEYIINANSAARLGMPFLDSMNKYADGGSILNGSQVVDAFTPNVNAGGKLTTNLNPKNFDNIFNTPWSNVNQETANWQASSLDKFMEDAIAKYQADVAALLASEGVGGGTGAQVAAYAKTFATGHGHPYVLGGASPSGWDCSGFSAYVYDHFGYFPGTPGQRFGTSETQYADMTHLQSSGNQTGALVFFDDHIFAPPGHVGIVLNSGSYVSAYDTAEGTVIKPISGPMGYRVPKGGFRAAGNGSTNAGAEQQYAFSQFGQYGWGGGQQQPLIELWNKESGWRWNATNPTSGAYGIPQALPASKMASAGADWKTNPDTQIRWGLGYIHGQYGSPSGAWSHEVADNWYADGGPISLAAGGAVSPNPTGDWAQSMTKLPADIAAERLAYDRWHTAAIKQKYKTSYEQAQWVGALEVLRHQQNTYAGNPSLVPASVYTAISNDFSNPAAMTANQWASLGSGLANLESWSSGTAIPSSNWRYEDYFGWPSYLKSHRPGTFKPSLKPTGKSLSSHPGYASWQTALKKLISDEAQAATNWNEVYGSGAPAFRGPGSVAVPGGASQVSVNLEPAIMAGGPAKPTYNYTGNALSGPGYGFADGGVFLPDVTLPCHDPSGKCSFAFGGPVGYMPAVISASSTQRPGVNAGRAEPSRTISDAAGNRVGYQHQGDIVINNPVAERASDSITRRVNGMSFLAGKGIF